MIRTDNVGILGEFSLLGTTEAALEDLFTSVGVKKIEDPSVLEKLGSGFEKSWEAAIPCFSVEEKR